jgi:hypothetical protein
METMAINPAQRMIIESFAATRDEEELNDLMDMLRNFYATRLKREMQRLWDNGTLDQTALDALGNEHLRTPYKSMQ